MSMRGLGEARYGNGQLLCVEHDEGCLLLHLQLNIHVSGEHPLLQIDVLVVDVVSGDSFLIEASYVIGTTLSGSRVLSNAASIVLINTCKGNILDERRRSGTIAPLPRDPPTARTVWEGHDAQGMTRRFFEITQFRVIERALHHPACLNVCAKRVRG